MDEYQSVTATEFEAMEGLDDWRFILGAIHGVFQTGSYPDASILVGEITGAAERQVHHPDIDIRYPGRVHVVITTHATGGVTTRDVSLALEITQLARHWEAVAEPATSQVVEIMIDALDIDAIRPFWQAVMGGYVDREERLIGDPLRLGPSIRFQKMDTRRDQRNRVHLDVEVPIEVAAERIAASTAAGGVLVSDEFAPAWWVLADPEGNEACICTTVE